MNHFLRKLAVLALFFGLLVQTSSTHRIDAASTPKTSLTSFFGTILSTDARTGEFVVKVKRAKRKIRIDSITRFFTYTDGIIDRVDHPAMVKGGRVHVLARKVRGNTPPYEGVMIVQTATPKKTQTSAPAFGSSTSTPPPEAITNFPPLFVANSGSSCASLPAPRGTVVTVSSEGQLREALKNPAEELTILVKDGDYNLSNGFWIARNKITIRSESGNRDKVILRGKGMNGGVSHIFWFHGSDITVADMTIGWVANHPIQVMGEADVDRPFVHNLRIVDAKEQLLKVSFDRNKPDVFSDGGVVECSLFEYTAGIGPQWYIGGIDAHHSRNWIVRDNVFRGIRSPNLSQGWAEHAVHFWSDSSGTIVERNTILNSDRGIGFGLGSAGHTGGAIRNNRIYHDTTRGDVGIGLESASGAEVSGNIIFFEHDYQNAIEYRFPGTTGVTIRNNIVNKKIAQREGGSAVLEGNVTNAQKKLVPESSCR